MVSLLERPAQQRPMERAAHDRGQPTLQVRMLGEFRLYVAGKRIPPTLWTGATRAKALFQYLAYWAGKPLDSATLLERLWPDVEPEVSQNTLHKAVYLLRQRLSYLTSCDGRELLGFADGCYTLSAGEVGVDTVAFKQNLFQASWCQRLGDAEAHRSYLNEAVALYSGDLLEEDYLIEWAFPERARLRHDVCRTLQELAGLARAAGEQDLAATHYRHLLAVEATSEAAYEALIEMALLDGRRGEALRLYQRYREVLKRELSLEPAPRVRQLIGWR